MIATLSNYTTCKRFALIFLISIHITFFSPCSGLIVTSYSKFSPDKSFETYLSKAIEQYKMFKKMFVVDNTTTKYEGI